jgi:DNA polymerase III psi subunit
MITVHDAIYQEEVYRFPGLPTVVLPVPWKDLPEDQLALLTKILQAIRLRLEAVRILHQKEFDLSEFDEKPALLIGFVTPPKGVPAYEVYRTSQTAMVFSDSLAVLVGDDAAKRKLWGALKDLFPS